MTKQELLDKAIQKRELLNQDWNFGVLSVLREGYKSPFFKVTKAGIFYIDDGKEEFITDVKYGEAIFNIKDIVEIKPNKLKIAPDGIKTTFGRVLANFILLEYGMSGKTRFIDGEVSLSGLEKIMLKNLRDTPINPEEMERGTLDKPIFYVSDFEVLSRADIFIQELAHLITVSATKKSLMKPADLEEFKLKVLNKLKKKYGDKLWSTELHAIEFVDEVKEHYKKFLEDDPSFGIVLSKKIFNGSYAKLNIAFGWEKNAFNKILLIK